MNLEGGPRNERHDLRGARSSVSHPSPIYRGPGQIRTPSITGLPAYVCSDELNDGSLVRVLPEWVAGTAQLSLVMPSRRGQSPSVRALADYLLNNLNARIGDRPRQQV
ncbi:MAG: LysR substrate-binding domain-containing protein [Halieaceae bacterium]|nr:LysR substrate-binding domain-containing protein [Halieaceae bacterium]